MFSQLNSEILVKDVVTMYDGFFKHMNLSIPSQLGFTASTLDKRFYFSYSGKVISPSFKSVFYSSETESEGKEFVAEIILESFKYKWEKQFAAFTQEYDMLNPMRQIKDSEYNETESSSKDEMRDTAFNDSQSRNISIVGDKSETGNNSNSDSQEIKKGTTYTDNTSTDITDTTTNNLKRVDTYNLKDEGSGNDNISVYGFNSSEAVPKENDVSGNNVKKTGTLDVADTGTKSIIQDGSVINTKSTSGSDKVTSSKSGSVTNNIETNDTETGTISNEGQRNEDSSEMNRVMRDRMDFTRIKGNIGNIANQQLIASEFDLWRISIINEILKDVKELITIPIYV